MTNHDMADPAGYRIGPDARVVIHRHGARRDYAVAVILDEGPYATASAALEALDRLREEHGGWVSKSTAAARLGISERQVDYLRSRGQLLSINDPVGHALISTDSLNAEIARRSAE